MPPDTPRRSLHALPPGTVLHDYVMDSELVSGGFHLKSAAKLSNDWGPSLFVSMAQVGTERDRVNNGHGTTGFSRKLPVDALFFAVIGCPA